MIGSKGNVTIKQDEQPINANLEKISKLRQAFEENGSVTAANSSSISDGAAALLVVSEEILNKYDLEPIA